MQYLKKEVNGGVFYGMQINSEVFYKLIISILVWVAKHNQSTQNKIFRYLCKYLQKNTGNDVNFLSAGKLKCLFFLYNISKKN